MSDPVEHEEWRTVPGFSRYEVSSYGRVRSLGAAAGLRKVPRIKVQSKDKDGYSTVGLCVGAMSKTRMFRVSRLVLTVFVGPCPDGHEAAHENGVRSDDRLANLCWKTPTENHADKKKHGTTARGSKNYKATIDEETASKIKLAEGTRKTVASQFGVSVDVVYNIKSGRSWNHV